MNWIRHNKFELMLALLVLSVALFLRFYRIADYMTFMGDEGRDALIVKDIIAGRQLPLVGPPISFSPEVGGLYLGPLYYYMMAVSMALSGLNPVGAAVMVAAIGIISVALIYYLSRVWFGKEAALLASFAYATSPAVVAYSRSSWNPNLAPFFALLTILGLFKSLETKNFRWFILSGAALACAVQMHYFALMLLPVTGLLWLGALYLKVAQKYPFHSFASGTIISVISFSVLMLPLVVFDISHEFTNFKALKSVFLAGESGLNLNPAASLARRIFQTYYHDLIGIYVAASNLWLTILIAVIVLAPLAIAAALKLKGKRVPWPFAALAVWLFLGLLGLSLYKREVYPHYLGFLSPAPFLLLGGFIYYLPRKSKHLLAGLLLLVFACVNLPGNPPWRPAARQLERTQQIARQIIKLSDHKPYNFALISAHNYDAGYRYYLEEYGHPPKRLPPEVTDQLLVVCEDPVCQPTLSAKDEIVAFGSSVEGEAYDLYGVRVFKLSHAPPKQDGK
jgi:4-amino-4-deoxy-L-arabinose transferase-like glycosyltransferase